jgi:hypothetical protein
MNAAPGKSPQFSYTPWSLVVLCDPQGSVPTSFAPNVLTGSNIIAAATPQKEFSIFETAAGTLAGSQKGRKIRLGLPF